MEVTEKADVEFVGYSEEGFPMIQWPYFNRKHDVIVISFPKGKPARALYSSTAKEEVVFKALNTILND